MLRHAKTDRICCWVLAFTLIATCAYMGAAASGVIQTVTAIGYENRVFDQSRVHTIDIVMDDFDAFLETCASEEYSACTLVIDGERYANVAIRGKGNTSLTSVASYGNGRYSFKVEFDRYQSGSTYHGLDKLCLNNLIQDNTYMKDYFAYTLMNKAGVASPLCAFAQISVNGEPWGLYLAVEGVEESFLSRNYAGAGELYKPDSISFGGGRGNGKDFSMGGFIENFGSDGATPPDMSQIPEGFQPPDISAMPDGFDIPEGFQQPGNFEIPSGFQKPDESGMPDGVEPSYGTDESAKSRRSQGAGMPDTANASKHGGGMSMGSDDVKLKYLGDDPASYENIFANAKTDISEADSRRLIAALQALGEGDPTCLDRDSVLRYMAVHNFLVNGDSYTGTMVHNYYLYEHDGALSMIPWDYNLAYGTFGSGGDATANVNSPIDSLTGSADSGDRPMADWIFSSDESERDYHEIYAEFIETVFGSGWFDAEIERVANMIAPYVENDPTAFCTYAEFETGVETLKVFCEKRAESVEGQLNGTIPSTTEGQADTSAFIDASDLTLSDMGAMNRGNAGGAEFAGDKTAAASEARDRKAAMASASEIAAKGAPAEARDERVAIASASEIAAKGAPAKENTESGYIWLASAVAALAAACAFAKFTKFRH